MSISPDRDDGPDRHGLTEVHWRHSKQPPATRALKLVQVCLAGPVVEMIYSGDPFHPGLVGEWAEDWRTAWSIAEALEADERKRLRLLERIVVDLYRQLKQDDVWAAVAELADQLLVHETLDNAGIREVLGQWL